MTGVTVIEPCEVCGVNVRDAFRVAFSLDGKPNRFFCKEHEKEGWAELDKVLTRPPYTVDLGETVPELAHLSEPLGVVTLGNLLQFAHDAADNWDEDRKKFLAVQQLLSYTLVAGLSAAGLYAAMSWADKHPNRFDNPEVLEVVDPIWSL